MVQVVRMPMMGNTMETGLLSEWHIAEGDEVEEGEMIAVVESEKVSNEVAAKQSGRLARRDVEEGEEVPPGTVIGVIAGPDEDLSEAPEPRSRIEPEDTTDEQPASDDGESTAVASEADDETGAQTEGDSSASGDTAAERVPAAPGARKLASEAGIDLASVPATGPDGKVLRADVEEFLEETEAVSDDSESATGDAGEGRTTEDAGEGHTFTSPTVRKLAQEHGVSLADIDGTGIAGRVTETDVRMAAGLVNAETSTPPSATSTPSSAPPLPTDQVTVAENRELSTMRRTIADRMVQSVREAPQSSVSREVSVDRALDTVDELRETRDTDVGFTDLVVGAAVRALESHPEFNAWFDGDRLTLVEDVNVAVAVDADQGLVTPVIREADAKTLDEIALTRQSLTESALDGSYSMADLEAGTFTISNLGMFDIDVSSPIVNPPQIAILAIGRIREDNGDRTCMLTLSFDHRVVDGADAARFMDTLADGITKPASVVADRATAGGQPERGVAERPDADRQPSSATGDDLEQSLADDISERAAEVSRSHGWPAPDFEVDLSDGDRPTVVVKHANGASPAVLKRLTYAACRESSYADLITGLRDPAVVVE